MRSLRSFAAIIFLAVFPSVALATDVITNVMSPIVSYQFPDDFNTQALTNGGISSPIISYQYFEWPGDDVLQPLRSPAASYFYQIGEAGPPLTSELSVGLTAYYPLDGDLDDKSGHSLNGAISNPAFEAGQLGQGLSLSALNDSFGEVPASDLLKATNAVTVSVWVKARSFPNAYSCVVYQAAATPTANGFSDRAYTMWVRSDGGVHLTSTSQGAQSQSICNSPSGGIEAGQFFHVVGIVDSMSQVMKIFINANLVASTPYPTEGIRAGSFPLRFGGPFFTLGDQSGFDGVLDEIRIYSRALSPSEIQQLYLQSRFLLHGRVTDTHGAGIPNATISATVGLTPAAQATADASGNYALPPLGAGVYVVTASASGRAQSSRALTLSAGTAVQNFQLSAMPAAPGLVTTNRQPMNFVFPPIGSFGESLKIFDGTVFTNITPATSPSTNRMTIVLTHGWIPQYLGYELTDGVDGWPTVMAAAMQAHGITTNLANIMAWDWQYAAQGSLPPEENIPGEGITLGQSLQIVLGAHYAQPVHLLGHSLGAQVNASAANYLHGDRTAQQPVSPTPWSPARTHLTLFDHAELSRIASVQVLFDGLTLNLGSPTDVLKYAAETLQGWKPSMPRRSAWADNYISLVGFYLPNTLNVALQKAVGLVGPIDAHSYPMTWYALSITNPTYPANPLGFKRSYEYAQLPGVNLPFPPSVADLSLGDAYHQIPSATAQLALEPLPPENIFQTIVPALGNGADVIVQGAVATVHVAGRVTAEIVNGAQTTARWISHGFNYVGNLAVQGSQTVLNLLDSPSMRMSLTTGLPPILQPAVGPVAFSRGKISAMDAESGATNSPPMVWLPVRIPHNAIAMAFDFTVEGNPMDDVLVCAIGETNLFSLEAKYIPTNTMSASRLMDVSAWAGTTNDLFFGFLGGTSTNATLIIENIRFYSVEAPRLEIVRDGDASHLSWSSTAGGYVVETTATLAAPAWEAMTNAPMILGDRYVLAGSSSDQTRFYRLRAR